MALPHLPAGESRKYSWAESIFPSDNLSSSAPTQRHVVVITHHEFGALEQQECILSQFWNQIPESKVWMGTCTLQTVSERICSLSL
jgi:hypothetical protein